MYIYKYISKASDRALAQCLPGPITMHWHSCGACRAHRFTFLSCWCCTTGNIVLYVRSCSVLGVVKEEVVREVFEANHTQEGCVQMTLYTSKLCMHARGASTYTHAHRLRAGKLIRTSTMTNQILR